MSFENGELNFKPLKPKPKSGFKLDGDDRDEPIDPIMENENEESAKSQADILLEQEEIDTTLAAAERPETAEAARKKKRWNELLNDKKDYLGPQRYDQAAWNKYNKKKNKKRVH